ncbi:retention module-containing protein [Pseudomonas cavernicola]|nr:retention module-containing protein [Pseudomonas cavernicola]
MSSVIAIVKSIVGQVIALTPEGAQRLLIEGDRLFKGEQLVTGPQSMVSLELTDGRIVDLGRDSQWSSAELEAQMPDAQQSASLSAAELQQAIAAGVDPTQEFAPTAAGPAGTGGAGGAVGGGHSFVLLEATAEQLDPTVGFATQGLDFSADALTEDLGTSTQDNAATVGNTGSAGSDTVAVDTSAPLAPSLTLSDDTGTSNADRITKDGTLSVGGIEPGSTVAYSTNGTDWSSTFSPSEGANTVYVRQTDSAGNVSPASPALTFTYDTSAPTVQVEITEAALKAGETSGVTFTFSEPPEGFALGDLSSAQGTFSNLTATGDPRVWTATFTPTADIENTATVAVSAGSYTDTAGNAGSAGSDTVAVDTSAPLAPSLTLSTDTGTSNADLISRDGTLRVGDIEPGSTVAYSTNGTDWSSTFSPSEGANTVYVRQTDSAGNVSPASPALTFTYDTSAPTVQVEITEAALKAGETSGVTFTFSEPPEGFALGDLSSAQGTFSNLTATGDPRVWTATFTPTADIENTATVAVSAGSYTDTAGNAGSAGSDTVAVDTSAPLAPSLTLSDDTGTSNADRITKDGTLSVGGIEPGSTVAYSTNGTDWSSTFSPSEGANTVYVRQTDSAGNVSPASPALTFTYDTSAPTVQVEITEAALKAGETSGVTFTFSEPPEGFALGDLSSAQGTFSNLTATGDPRVWTATFTPTADIENTATVAVSAGSYTDTAGNAGSAGSDTVAVDTSATAAPTVTISTDSNDDGTLSSSELGSATSVAVSIGLPAGAVAGDTLTVTDGTTPQTFVLTPAQVLAGSVATSFARPVDGQPLNVSATVTDQAGNTSAPGSDSAIVGDTTATAAPTVTISTDANNDAVLSNSELGSATSVAVSIGLPAGAIAGDSLTVSDGSGTPQTFVLTDAQIAAGAVITSFARPADGQPLNVSASVIDQAGNTSAPGSDSASVGDTTAPTVSIGAIAGNDVVDDSEDNSVTIAGTTSGVENGQLVSVMIDGVAVGTATVTNNVWSLSGVDLSGYADGQTYSVTADVSDAAGNPAVQAERDIRTTDTTAPTVSIGAIAGNDVVDDSEDNSVTIAGTTSGVENGQLVSVMIDGVAVGTAAVSNNAWSLSGVDLSGYADGQAYSVTADVSDAAGNPAVQAERDIRTTDTTAPTVSIGAIAGNDVVDDSEDNSVTIAGTTSGVENGQLVSVMIDGVAVGTATVTNNVWSLSGVDLSGYADGQTYSVTADVSDAAGNPAVQAERDIRTTDTTAPTVSIGAIAGNDVVDDSEDNSVTIAGTTSGVENGQLVSVMIDGVAVGTAAVSNNAWSLSGVDLSGYADGQAYSVTADVSDAAGNPAVQAARDIRTTDTSAPTVSIGAIAGNDVVDDSEDNSVTIAGTTSGVENGQLVSVMIDGVAVGTAAVSNNAWSLSGVDLSGYADGQAYSVTADVSDAAGNPAVQAERDIRTTDTTAPTVSIGAIAGNDVVDDSEDNSVTIAGTTSGVENGQLVSVMIDGVAVGTATVTNNAWSLSGVDLSGYADGQTYSVTADVSDAAGNPAVQAERDIRTTDTSAPTVSIGAIAGNDVVDDSEDNSVTIAGTTSGVENGQLVSVMIDGVAVGTATVTNNAWSLSGVDLSGYADGQTYSVTADVSDAAGNPAVQAERDIRTTDTSAPTVTASQTFNYAENQVAGSTLGAVAASDSVGVTGYRFSNGTQVSADGFFAISNSGAITLTAAGAAAGAATNDFETGANSFTVQVVALDAAGNSSPVTNVTLNLTNLNEAPAGTDNTFSINEDSSKVFAASDFGFSDVDAGDSLQAVRIDALPGAGSLTLGGVAVSAGQVISLAQLGSLTFTPAANANGNNYASLSFSVQDASGAFSPAPNTLTLNVTPVNDTPVATATSATAVEDGAAITGQLAASDLDQDAMLTFSLNAAAPAGFSLDSTTGSWTFDPSNAAYQALAAGEERQINVPFSVTDEHGAASQSVLNLTITGTNDAPLMQASLGNVAGVITKPQTQANHSFASAIGLDGSFVQVANADVLNSTTTPFVSINSIGNGAADYYVFTVTQAGSTAVFDIDHARAADGSGLDSVIHLWDANGTRLTYNDDAAITSGAGGSAHDYDAYLSYTFAQPGTYYISVGSYLAGTDPFNPNNSISAGLGYQLQVSLTNALTGATGSLTERVDGSANENSGNLTSSGVLTFSDVDLIDTHTVNAILQSASDSLNGTTAARGSFTPVISDPASGDGAGEISWTYTVAAGALDDLAAGQALTLVYRVSVTDNHGAQSYRDVTISLTGTNDAPVVGTGSAIVSEEGLTGANADSLGSTDTTNSLTVTGNISISDVDAGSSFIVTLGAPSTALTSGGQSVQWSGSGTNLLTGSAGGKTIVTIGIDNQGNYSVALAGPLDHAGTSSEDLRSFGVTVNVNDGSTTTSNTLTINVEDDSPTLGTPTGVELMTAAGTIATGNLGLSIGADATGSEVQFSSISGSVDATGNILASTYDQNGTLISSSTYLTYQDSKLHYVNAADGSLTAITSDGTAVFKVSANPVTGEYQVTNFKTLDSAIASISNFNISGGNSGVFQLGAGSHFEMVATATTNGIVSTVNTSANFFGVAAGQSIDAEDVLSFTLRDVDTQAATTMTSMSFKTDKLGNGETLTWTAYAADGSSLGNGTVAGQNGSDASFTVSTSLLNGHAFSSISLGASSGTSYKLMINGISGHASAYDQSIKLGVAGVDGDGDSTTIKSLNIAFDGGFTSSESITGTSSNDAINQATSTTSKLISTLGGNDYVEAGAGNDFIYLGDSGNNNHPVTGLAVTRADVSATNLLNLDDSALLLSDSTLSLTARMTSASSSQPASEWADLGHAGSGNDHVFGEAGVDLIYGGAGSDVLYGGAGVDGLRGGSGNDILVGGTGNDVMRGDAGKDSFVWRAGDTGNDVIKDFSAAQGDRIDLSDLLPDNASNDILSYLQVNTATSTLQVSTTGNFAGGADVTIQLQGVDLTTYGASSAQIVNSLIAGADPLVKVDQN